MDPPVYNPSIPYTGYINGGFRPGRLVRVQGKINPNAHTFSINLQCGPSSSHDDVALHINPRFTEHAVIRNSKNYSSWGNEERHGMSFPFIPGQSFEIMVMCESQQFKVAINGQHFTEYNHRVPVERITSISIDGDITIALIQFEGSSAGGVGYAPSAPPVGTAAGGMPPYPPSGGGGMPMGFVSPPYSAAPPQSGYPPPNAGGYPPPPHAAGGGYPPQNPGGYPPPNAGYPPQGAYGAPAPGPYPQQPGGYPQAGYPQQGYPQGQHGTKSGGGIMDSAGKLLAGGLAGVGLAKVASKIPGMGGHGHGHGGHQGFPMGGLGGGGHHGGGGGGGGLGGILGGAAALGLGGAVAGKALKGHKKKNKLLKYGVPLAGVGLGGYALKKGMKGFKGHGHHGHGSSSSSSYSSDSD